MVMQIDLHRAGLGARAAQRRSVGEVLKFVEPAQMRREHTAYRPWIRCAVSVATDSAKYRAGIQAGATANAMQYVALLGVSKQFAAAVVEQHDVKFLRPIWFIRLARPTNQRVVAGHRLPSARSREYRPKNCQVLEARDNLFNSRNGHVNARKGRSQVSIAFVGGNGDHSCIGNQKIGSADSHFSGEESFAQPTPRGRD